MGTMLFEMRNEIGNLPVIEGGLALDDNLAIALATYFSSHPDRPESDKDDDELGWGLWVIGRVDDMLDRIIKKVRL